MTESEKSSRNVLRLGWVSLLNDLGSETLTRLIPLYVAGVLGAPMTAVGAIEGIADSASVLLKPVFGSWSDRLRKRKAFVVWGYWISAVARPFLAIATSWPGVAALRFSDRLGKGVRTAPRNALIAESSTGKRHGFAFGLNRSLDTVGAILGVAAFAFWSWKAGAGSLSNRTWIGLTLACSIPGFLAVAVARFGITDPPEVQAKTKSSAGRLHPIFLRYLVVVILFSLANSSDAFILLRAKELGYDLTQILGVIILLNIVSSMTAIPAAALSDRIGRRTLIAAGWIIYALAYALLGAGFGLSNFAFFGAVIAVYGLFYGFTESVELAWVADLIPAEDRGRAYGVFGLAMGITALPASVVFGWIWDRLGSQVAFLSGAALAGVATLALLGFVKPAIPKTALNHR